MITKQPIYTSYIDSISLRINELRIQPLFLKNYIYEQKEDGTYLFLDKQNHNYIFKLKDQKDKHGTYQILSFNGFKKYKQRDKIIEKAFNDILLILKGNDINFFITKIDLAVDFTNIELEYILNSFRYKQRNLKTNTLKKLCDEEQFLVETNNTTFYFEAPVKKNHKRKQRAYIYNKGIKENLASNRVYRFEVSMNNFNELFNDENLKTTSLDILALELKNKNNLIADIEFKIAMLQQEYNYRFKQLFKAEVTKRFSLYYINFLGKKIDFENSLIDEIIEKGTYLSGV
jgi:predicted metallopeptidase